MNTFDPIDHIYRIDGVRVPSANQVLELTGFVNFKGIPKPVLEAAREFGSAVHKTCELHDKDDLVMGSVDTRILPYLNAWMKFRKDNDFNIMTEIEVPRYSNVLGFAGTPDRVGRIKDNDAIVEIKTSHDISSASRFQVAGYSILAGISRRIIVLLKPDGTYDMQVYSSFREKEIFKSALTVVNARKLYCKENIYERGN